MIEIYFDGACEPKNPEGIATFGFVIYNNREKIVEDKGLACKPFSWQASNNVAEYTAMIKAFEWLLANFEIVDGDNIKAYGDSQLAIRQMTGEYTVNAERIRPLYKKACVLREQFKSITFLWVPREKNTEADALSHQAYEEYIDLSNQEIKAQILSMAATTKQKAFMDRLNIKYNKYISKREASRLISEKVGEK